MKKYPMLHNYYSGNWNISQKISMWIYSKGIISQFSQSEVQDYQWKTIFTIKQNVLIKFYQMAIVPNLKNNLCLLALGNCSLFHTWFLLIYKQIKATGFFNFGFTSKCFSATARHGIIMRTVKKYTGVS